MAHFAGLQPARCCVEVLKCRMTTHPVDCVIHTWHRKPRQGGLEAVEQRSATRKHLHKTLESNDKESTQTEQWSIKRVEEGEGAGWAIISEDKITHSPAKLLLMWSFSREIRRSSHGRRAEL